MRLVSVFVLAILMNLSTSAQNFTKNEQFRKSYTLLLDLKFEEAEKQIQSIRMVDEQNLAAIYLEDLSDFLYIVVTEDAAEFEKRKEQKQARLDLINELPSSSPFKLLTAGEIHLHWAFSSMRFGEYLSAANGINRAFKLLEKNIKKHPDFLPTYKSMGLLHTLVGTVPDNYRWATKLMGVDGTIDQGITEMEVVLEKSDDENLKKETLFLLTFLHINLLNDAETLGKYQELVNVESGPLMDFAKASLLKENGQTDEAISALESNPKSLQAFPYLRFLLGELKLARMDVDATEHFEDFIDSFKGSSYRKASAQKMAWHALLVQMDETEYKKRLQRIGDQPSSILDEDKAAQKELESGRVPNKVLLKARLQFDAGFYREALTTLIKSDSKDLKSEDENLEFTYRLARIHDELGNENDAISYYNLTIESGADSKRYFAANSSLMLGLLYEQSDQKEKALNCFKACSEFNNSEYRNSINQKAKAGILRLND